MSVLLKKRKFKNIVILNYSRIKNGLYWNQQLIAESLGKNGKGFLPLVSQRTKRSS